MCAMWKEEYLELGIIHAQECNFQAALDSLRQALLKYTDQEDSLDGLDAEDFEHLPPELLSYYGLCIAQAEDRVGEGTHLCRLALARDSLRPDFYLNLGRIYLQASEKEKALETFHQGLGLFGNSQALIQEWRKMGIRKRRVLNFLPRDHFVNRCIGRLFYRIKGERKAPAL